MNLNLRPFLDGALRTLAASLAWLGLVSAAVAAAAFPVWLATPFLTGTTGMQLRSAVLLAGALEVLIGVLTVKLWQSRIDERLLRDESSHFRTPFPYGAASATAILASFLLDSLGALTLFRAHIHGAIGLLAEAGVPTVQAPIGLILTTVMTAALARIAAYAALTLAYPWLMQTYERRLRRRLARRELEILSDKALEDHRALIHRTNVQAREVATAHRTVLFERG